MDVLLQYYDSNGHNFGVITPLPNVELVEHVFLALPGEEEKELIALAAYRKAWRATLRSKNIATWLRGNFHPGQQFSATLVTSDEGREHHYSNIHPII